MASVLTRFVIGNWTLETSCLLGAHARYRDPLRSQHEIWNWALSNYGEQQAYRLHPYRRAWLCNR